MGISGFTCFLTGEAAVNPQIPAVSQPFTICREMARRLCVAHEDAANFSAYLACEVSESREFRYSGYFMAFRYCYNTLYSVDPAAATRIMSGCVNELVWDLDYYNHFFTSNEDPSAVNMANTVSSAYLKISGEDDGTTFRSSVSDYLVNWYLDQYAEPEEVEQKFDPFDENQVDLSGIVNAKPQETEPSA